MGDDRATDAGNRDVDDRGLAPLGQRWQQAEPRTNRSSFTPKEAKRIADATAEAADHLLGLPREKHLPYLRYLQKKNAPLISELLVLVRNGQLPGIRLPLALHLIAQTPWASSERGGKVIKQLASMYPEQRITLGKEVFIGNAITIPDNAAEVSNMQGSASHITLSETNLALSPEATAAVAAHEGLHAYRMGQGIVRDSLLQSETDAEMAAAAVWSTLSAEKKRTIALIVYELEETAEHFDASAPDDDTAMRIHVAAVYAFGFAKGGKVFELDKAARIIEELLGQGNGEEILRLVSDMQLKRLYFAYSRFMSHSQSTKSRKSPTILQRLYQEIDKRNLWD